jgi:transcriptional regulator with XRE-family HTH domain
MSPASKKIRPRDALALELGRAIRAARDQTKLSQDELAFQAGIHRAYMGAVEQGRFNVTVKRLTQICAALRLKPSQLFARMGR